MGQLTDPQLKAWLRDHRKTGAPLAGKADGDGLTFTITKAGAREGFGIWGLRYRHGAKQHWLPLGRYPDVSLADARERATRERVRVFDGVHVAAERRRVKVALRVAQTFKDLAEDYMARVAVAFADSTRGELRRYLAKDILPRIGGLSIEEVTSADVVDLVERVAKRSPSVARRCFETLSVIFAHGLAKHVAKHNPCAGLKVSAIIGVTRPKRERIMLSEDELRAVLAGLPALGQQNALAVRVLLATCVRKSELYQARWDHVDFGRAEWTIPAENSKSDRGFVIPLPATVIGWFTELRQIAGTSPWVLPGRKGMHISRTTLNVALDRLGGAARRISPHDLRSTARSHLAALGVDVIVAERCLNHTLGGLVAVYDRHDYMAERRRALDLWANFLEACEQPRPWNVTQLRAPQAA